MKSHVRKEREKGLEERRLLYTEDLWYFPGGPGVRILVFHYHGPGSIPGGETDLASHTVQPKQNKKLIQRGPLNRGSMNCHDHCGGLRYLRNINTGNEETESQRTQVNSTG